MRQNKRTNNKIIVLILAGALLLAVWPLTVLAGGTVDEPTGLIQETEPPVMQEEESEQAPEDSEPTDAGGTPDKSINPGEPHAEHEEKEEEAQEEPDGDPERTPDEGLTTNIEDIIPEAPPAGLGASIVIAFAPLDAAVAEQDVILGSPVEDLLLPDILAATVEYGDGSKTDDYLPVEHWNAEPEYEPQALGSYIFTPQLATEGTLPAGLSPPQIMVRVLPGVMPLTVSLPVSTYAELATQIAAYASATDDLEIILASGFPTDSLTQVFTVPANNGGHTLTIRSADGSTPAVLTRSTSGTKHLFTVGKGAHLILRDIVLDGGKDNGIVANGSLVSVHGGEFTMQTGAVLRNNNYSHSKYGAGGGVTVSNGTFRMEDGVISDNEAVYGGGGVFVPNTTATTSTFILEGGRISGNTTDGEGGGVYVSANFTNSFSTFILKGGTISGNTATYGGGVQASSKNCTITMEGGEILDNVSDDLGGGIRVVNCRFTMKDGLISSNQGLHGGGVHVGGNGSSFTMEDGRILSNTASGTGGGLHISNSNAAGDGFTMQDGIISNNQANHGGGISAVNSYVTIENAQILNNTAQRNGGGISTSGIGDFTIENALISKNTANLDGGGLFLSGKTVTMQQGRIVDNIAKLNGGGVYCYNGGRFIMKDGLISGNTATGEGGGVFGYDDGKFTMEDGLILDNSASDGNGVYAVKEANLTMHGGLIFGRGGTETAVTFPETWEPEAGGDGVVIRWSGPDGSFYYYGDDIELYPLPQSSTQATWIIDAGRHGVAYARDTNIGFLELPVTVIYPIATTVTVSAQGGANSITAQNGSLQMLATVQPSSVSQSVIWTVVPDNIATISSSGLMTALDNGTVTVRATATDGSGAYGEMQVIINWRSGSGNEGNGSNSGGDNGDGDSGSGNGNGGNSGGNGGPKIFTVTYHANGHGAAPAPDRVEQGASYTVARPTRLTIAAGWRFQEWNTSSTGDGTAYTPGQTLIMPGRDLDLYAILQAVDEVPQATAKTPFLNTKDHYAYMIGYPDGLIRPQNNVTRAEAATIFFRLLTDQARTRYLTRQNTFSDVAEEDWFNTAVSTLASMRTLVGASGGRFRPDDDITRAELAVVAARHNTAPVEGAEALYDISGHWAEQEIRDAIALGWVTGYPDGTFRPDQAITRQEMMALVNRVLNRHIDSPEDLVEGFIEWPDNPRGSWAFFEVEEATNSHDYITDDRGEHWRSLRTTRDWTVYQ